MRRRKTHMRAFLNSFTSSENCIPLGRFRSMLDIPSVTPMVSSVKSRFAMKGTR